MILKSQLCLMLEAQLCGCQSPSDVQAICIGSLQEQRSPLYCAAMFVEWSLERLVAWEPEKLLRATKKGLIM